MSGVVVMARHSFPVENTARTAYPRDSGDRFRARWASALLLSVILVLLESPALSGFGDLENVFTNWCEVASIIEL